jgi:Domain of unknown function (DUF4153)
MDIRSDSLPDSKPSLPLVLVVAVAQGWALYGLHLSLKNHYWPATNPAWLLALYTAAVYAPITIQFLIAHIQQRAAWAIMGALLALYFYLGWFHGISIVGADQARLGQYATAFPLALELVLLWLLVLPFVQIRLVTGRWTPEYVQLFAIAWRNKLTLAEAGAFTALFWGLLFLWQALFHELKIDFFRDLFQEPIFIYPVTTLAFGVALQLIGSLENWSAVVLEQLLNLLKWLGVVAGIILTFFTLALLLKLPTLVFSGERAIGAAWLLWLVAVVVLFTNAAYRDGSAETPYPRSIATAVRVTIPLLMIVALTAVYAVVVRTKAYGLTFERFWALVAGAFAIIYAFGYSWASLHRQPWMVGMGRVNVITALGLIGVLVLALTPILSPFRLAADSQYQRALRWKAGDETGLNGIKSPFHYLRFNSGAYGTRRLQQLANLSDGAVSRDIRSMAAAALAQTNEWAPEHPADVEDRISKIMVYPSDRAMTDDLRQALVADLKSPVRSPFLSGAGQRSWVGLYIDLNGSHEDQFVLFAGCMNARVYQHLSTNWQVVGSLSNYQPCKEERLKEILASGAINAVPRSWSDLKIGEHLYRFEPLFP